MSFLSPKGYKVSIIKALRINEKLSSKMKSCHPKWGMVSLSKYISSLKVDYNKLLVRFHKGCDFLENKATEAEVEKWLPLLEKIISDLSMVIVNFKKTAGREMTTDEIINGFKDVRI